jgi:hypothetical protein
VGFPVGSILISEVAWAGTQASAHDEWIELYNPGEETMNLQGWILTDGADITILLELSIAPHSFALLERTDDSTVASIPADQIYTGSLKNSGDELHLYDPIGKVIDSANAGGGTWPAGHADSRSSMERRGGEDQPGNWATFLGFGGHGYDSAGNLIHGTPRGVNSIHLPSPTPDGSPLPLTPSATPTTTPSPAIIPSPLSVMINEVAWAGTTASSSDEWIELYNPGDQNVSLEGWRLEDGGDLAIALHGIIAAQGYYLLERSDDQAVTDLSADLIYTGSLLNSGETLRLFAPGGGLIDSANADGGAWPAGRADSRSSMERRGGEDQPGNWGTFTGYHGAGIDADGNPVQGTPRQINSVFFPTPQPTWIPGKVVVNEALIRPHYDWEGVGGVDTDDEFIELLNLGPLRVNLRGWLLDDIEEAGSRPYALPPKTLNPGEYYALFRSRTHIALNDGGDSVRLIAPDGRVVDQLTYLRVRAYNLSYGRLPDGSGKLAYGLWPTPGKPNLLFKEPVAELVVERPLRCVGPQGFPLQLARLGRHVTIVSQLSARGFKICWRNQ